MRSIEPGIHNPCARDGTMRQPHPGTSTQGVWIPGSRQGARPGMTRIRSLLQPRPSALPIPSLRNLENIMPDVARQLARQQRALAPDAADLGHRALRAPVFLADPEHHGVDEGEGMVEHQALDLAVRGAAPMAARDEGPA